MPRPVKSPLNVLHTVTRCIILQCLTRHNIILRKPVKMFIFQFYSPKFSMTNVNGQYCRRMIHIINV